MELLDNLRKTFSDRLKFYRGKRGWDQHDLAAAAKMKTDRLRTYEQKTRWPKPEEIDALAKALEIPVWFLFQNPSETGKITADDLIRTITAVFDDPDFSLLIMPNLRTLVQSAHSRKKD